MTPKEKALQLCDAFYQYLPLERYVATTEGDLSWEYDSWENAKQCALIAIREVIDYSKAHGFIGLTNYYLEVQQEIHKL